MLLQAAEKVVAFVFGWERRASALRKTQQIQGALAPGLSSFQPQKHLSYRFRLKSQETDETGVDVVWLEPSLSSEGHFRPVLVPHPSPHQGVFWAQDV
jgi:hypothetical protein